MSYTTIRMTACHQEAVIGLWRQNMAALKDSAALAERFHWFYDENPAGSADTVLATTDLDGSVVGCASAFPRAYRVAGHDLTAGVPVDFAVTRAHRTAAAALSIQRGLLDAQSTSFSFFCGFPNKAALPILLRVGYKRLATGGAWIKPLRADYKLVEYLKVPSVAALAGTAPNAWLGLSDAWRSRGRTPVRHAFTAAADERFDRLWARARDNYRVAGQRSSDYLNWRYARFRTLKYEFFCLSEVSSSELLGYVVFFRQHRKVFVGDLFAVDMQRTAEHLLLEFSRALRRQRVDSIFLGFAGNADFQRRLEALGFIRRPVTERSMVVLPRTMTEEQRSLISDPENWYLFDGEMDI